MGVTAGRRLSELRTELRAVLTLRRLALASVIVNVGIVVTGGAVRLTGSGLGCPTFPKCGDGSLVPVRAFGVHGIIEFTNRQLTFVVSAVVIATLVVAILDRREVRLAALLAASIPAQALLGGITVLTHLNPWTVAAHFMLSMGILAVAYELWWRTGTASGAPTVSAPVPGTVRLAARAITALTLAVLIAGTVVTGSGPHPGAADTSGKIHRTGLNVASMSQLHADLVMLLIGLSAGFALLLRAGAFDKAGAGLHRAAWQLVAVELAQGVIGFVQYFTHLPALLVDLHMLGACLVWLAALRVLTYSSATLTTAGSARSAGLANGHVGGGQRDDDALRPGRHTPDEQAVRQTLQ